MTRRKPGGLTAARQAAKRARCVYCGRRTSTPATAESTPLARYPHAVRLTAVPPRCAAAHPPNSRV